MNKTTIQEIAADLGLSITTISFIINGKGDQYKISKATQERVKKYIAQNNYQPNSVARSLTTGKSYTIGYLVPDISDPFYAAIGKHVENILSQQGYQLFMCSTKEDPDTELKIVQSMVQRQADGIIMAPTTKKSLSYIKSQDIPLVTFDRQIPRSRAHFVGIDNYEASKSAITAFLTRNKNAKMAMVSMTPEVNTLSQRIEGCLDAFKELGLHFPEDLNLNVDYQNLQESCLDQIGALLQKHPEVNSFYFTNNLTAYKGLYALNKNHRPKLEKMKLISFDDMPLFEISHPFTTGIEQPQEKIGETSAQMLLELLHSKNTSSKVKKVILPVQINWR
ncbi:MAG: LacI family DNA-binding transcriptional regulator [Planctomycetes bacterium]|nr:LacI family DNA-binding transcriptional regulator [Planctomycetota bacterium]